LSLKNNIEKLRKHLEIGGIGYAFRRAIKYFLYLLRAIFLRFQKNPEEITMGSKVKLRFGHSAVHLFFNGTQVTSGPGLYVAINSLGVWEDLAQADLKIVKKQRDSVTLRIRHRKFPVTQFWNIKREAEGKVSWKIKIQIRETMHIDEICIACGLHPQYKSWVKDYLQNDFPAFGAQWRDIYLEDVSVFLLGARIPVKGATLPSLALELNDSQLFPFIRNSPQGNSFHVIGTRHTVLKSISKCSRGMSVSFSQAINFFENDADLDLKIELFRRKLVAKAISEKTGLLAPYRKRILLVNLPWQRRGCWGVRAGSRWPHIKDVSEGDYLPFPFFLSYATALLKNNDFSATIIDAVAEQMTEAKLLEFISGNKFDYVVAETSIPSFSNDLRILGGISKLRVSIILCGPNYQIYKPEFLQQHRFIDFVLYGEYEFNLLQLMRCFKDKGDVSGVSGLLYRKDGKVYKTESGQPFDLNLLPWPERESLPLLKYLDAPGGMLIPSAQIIASRGCPFGCKFCLWPQVVYQGRHYRARNVIDVIDEMEYLVREKGFKSVYFDDDTFNIGKERMFELCGQIIKRGLNHTQWAIMARPDLMDESLLDKFKEAGLYAVKYGVESGVQDLLDNIGKAMDLEYAQRMIRYTQKIGIKTHLTFTFGLPGETRETIEKTIALAKSLDPFSVQFSLATPFPGTEYHRILEKCGSIISKDLSSYDGHSSSVIKLENLGSGELEEAKERAYQVWFEYVGKRRGFLGNIKRVYDFLNRNNISYVLKRTVDYSTKALLKKGIFENKHKDNSPDILLIQCPPWDFSMAPLGVAYLSSYLEKLGYKADVFDLNIKLYNSVAEKYRHYWEQKNICLWSVEDLFENTWSMLQDEVLSLMEDAIKNGSPCIGLSVNFGGIRFAIKLLNIIRQKNKSIKIIVGGWGVIDEYMRGLFPKEMLDAFVIGEGEQTLVEVIDVFRGKRKDRNVLGAIFTEKENSEFKLRKPIADINTIPWPTFSDFDLKSYKNVLIPLFTSRGCIGHCTFCNDWVYSKPYRFRNAKNIFKEIRYHVENNRVNAFSFKDLLCNGNLRELGNLCDFLIESGLEIAWDSQAITRREMTYEFLCKLKKSGCTTLIYGIESFSDNVLRRMGKIFDRETAELVLKSTHKADIGSLINIIVGFPGETEQDFQETLDALELNRPYLSGVGAVSVCLVNGNSPLCCKKNEFGIITSSEISSSAKQWISSDGKNTYEIRKQRAEKVIELITHLGLSYETATI
jgi:radical SAM superfamily enzyme YgiQ (UPF0313 family)